MKDNNKTLMEYLRAINNADVERIYNLLTDDFLFIDAHDNRVVGKEEMKTSWIEYFKMFPDYTIEVKEVLKNDYSICLLGYASGTYKNLKDEENSNFWKIPAAWKVIIDNGKIKHWQVYADNIIVMEIINRNTCGI